MIRIIREKTDLEKDCHVCGDKIPAKTPFLKLYDAEGYRLKNWYHNFCPKCADKPLSAIALEQKL